MLKYVFLFLLTAGFYSDVRACDVPVFRYALERWSAEVFEVLVFHRGPLGGERELIVRELESQSLEKIPYANYTVRDVDLGIRQDSSILDLWESLDHPELPCLALRMLRGRRAARAVWAGPLASSAAESIIDSPARQEAGRLILDEGASAVWVLLECGDRKKDEAAARVLEEHLPVMEKTLRLPEAVDRENLEGLSRLRVGFPLIRLSRLEMREEVFIRMLMNTEPDLDLYADWPMAFPVYGRGRTLYALVGEGITAENIEEACAFLTGPCACEIKDLNPGMDLLMAVDWQSGLGGSWVAEVDIPPLTGLSGLSQAPAAEVAAGAGPGGNPLWRNILLAIGLVAALVLLSTIVVLKTGKRR